MPFNKLFGILSVGSSIGSRERVGNARRSNFGGLYVILNLLISSSSESFNSPSSACRLYAAKMLRFIVSHDWIRFRMRYVSVASRGGSSIRFAFFRILTYKLSQDSTPKRFGPISRSANTKTLLVE